MRIAAFFIVLLKLLASLLMLLGVVWACGALWFQLAQSVKSGSARGLLLGVWVGWACTASTCCGSSARLGAC